MDDSSIPSNPVPAKTMGVPRTIPIMARVRTLPLALRGLTAILVMLALMSALTASVASLVGAPFTLWFSDTPIMLAMVLVLLVLISGAWDSLLILAGLNATLFARTTRGERRAPLERWRRAGFFSAAPLGALAIVLLSAYAVLQTSNVTLIDLTMLNRGIIHWRDAALWRIEAPLFALLERVPLNVAFFDWLYHTSWIILLTVCCTFVIKERNVRLLLHFCLGMIITFYLGRLAGSLDPVKGPAFFAPEHFRYVSSSVTGLMMRSIATTMTLDPQEMMKSGILVGGVAAMPSLHLALVTVTTFWLAQLRRWTLMLTLPWVALIWLATLALGWHYALDGVGGIALALLCVPLTRWYGRWFALDRAYEFRPKTSE
ncbi:MAG: phosphatase PAP2 family protein [Acidobacteriota bacterium]